MKEESEVDKAIKALRDADIPKEHLAISNKGFIDLRNYIDKRVLEERIKDERERGYEAQTILEGIEVDLSVGHLFRKSKDD